MIDVTEGNPVNAGLISSLIRLHASIVNNKEISNNFKRNKYIQSYDAATSHCSNFPINQEIAKT